MMASKRANTTNCNGQDNSVAANLPEDIISDILARLPVESVLVCKVICKNWYAVTRDPCFIKKVSNSPQQPSQLIIKTVPGGNEDDPPCHMLLHNIEGQTTRQIPIDRMIAELQIMCSCDGFLCMASPYFLDPVVIYNPITGDRLVLPSSGSVSGISHQAVGFGFDPSTEKYKVVRAYTISGKEVTKFEIISIGEKSWRELCTPRVLAKREGVRAVCWDGALYWTMKKSFVTTIVQLDLRDEKFRYIKFPNADHVMPCNDSFGLIEVGGCLTLMQAEDCFLSALKLMETRDGENPAFRLEGTYDMHVTYGRSMTCEILCQLKPRRYLIHVGILLRGKRQEHLTQFLSDEENYLIYDVIPGLPSCFSALCFKPTLLPLPAAASSPN
ncbi:hypothetical protein NMG60_11023937 [Bertholletia excelsa]